MGKSICGYWMQLEAESNILPPFGRHESYGNFSLDTSELLDARWCDNSTTYKITITAARGQDGVYDGVALSELVFYGPSG